MTRGRLADERYLECLEKFAAWCEARRLPMRVEMIEAMEARMDGRNTRSERQDDMGFEIVTPTTRRGIAKGQAKIIGKGLMQFAADDLRAAKIGKTATLLADAATGRIAIRPPRENEPTVVVRWNKTATNASVQCGPALRCIGQNTETLRGLREASVKEDLLTVSVTSVAKAK